MRHGLSRGAAVALAAAALPALAARADCNTNFMTVGIAALQNGSPVAGPLREGQAIVFRAGIVVPMTDPPIIYCCVAGGTLMLELPGGQVVEAEVPLVCARTPFYLAVPYVVSAQDAAACRLTAAASYRDGVYLSEPPTRGAGGSASLTLSLDECCQGDVDGDAQVSVADLIAVVISWGTCGGVCPADIDGDGVVDQGDLYSVIVHWGACG